MTNNTDKKDDVDALVQSIDAIASFVKCTPEQGARVVALLDYQTRGHKLVTEAIVRYYKDKIETCVCGMTKQ